MEWYYLRLHITVTPTDVDVRPSLEELLGAGRAGEATAASASDAPPGAGLLSRFPSAVLGARDGSGAPFLEAVSGGFRVAPPHECEVTAGPASLLVHRHDDKLAAMRNPPARRMRPGPRRAGATGPGRPGCGEQGVVNGVRPWVGATVLSVERRRVA
ncbi:hypothetical protein [Actinoallomurus oryzae]